MSKHGVLKEHSFAIGLIQKLLDVLAIILLLMISRAYYGQDWFGSGVMIADFCAVALFLFFANLCGLYRSWRIHSVAAEFKSLMYTLSATILGLLLLAYATKTSSDFSRLVIGTWWLSLPVVLILVRGLVRNTLNHFRGKGYNTRTVAILGSGESAQNLALEIDRNEWMGLTVEGFYDNRHDFRESMETVSDIAIKGRFNDLIRSARAGQFDEIYVALPMRAEHIIVHLIEELSDSSIPVHIVPDLFTFNLLNSRTTSIGRIPIVSVYESPLDEVGVIMKRIVDLGVGGLILLGIAIPMLFIALAIKLTSEGPIIFKQRRYGMKGDEIEVWKFRSMTTTDNGDDIKQAAKGDARITPLGAFLRKTSLDELPQFINVLQGSMSIVGPRPHAVAHNELYRKSIKGYMLRHLVKPGITGWAQINGWRGETDTDEKMQKRIDFDLEYLKNWSIYLDLKIILLTVFKGFINKNAY